MVLHRIMIAINDCRMANQLCWGLLQVAHEMAIGPSIFGTCTPDPGIGEIFEWLAIARPRKKLSPQLRVLLFRTMIQCERLWTTKEGLPVKTNLFKLFRLPSTRNSIERLAREVGE